MRAIAQQCSYVVGVDRGAQPPCRYMAAPQIGCDLAKVEAAVILWRQWDPRLIVQRRPRRWGADTECVSATCCMYMPFGWYLTRDAAAARGARPPSSLRGPCGGVAARGTIRIPNRSVRYAYGTEHIPNKGQKARRLRHAATRDFLAELAASRGAGRSCLDSGTSRPSTLPRR